MTHPLPKPPPCPPDPWPLIGKAWQEMQAFREMLWQVLLDMSMTDPRFAALLQNFIINALVADPRITQLLQTMIDQGVSNAITSDTTIINQLTTLINETIAASKIGVTDGSDAKPGEIGEWIVFDVAAPFAGYPTFNDTTITLATIPAGDWDIWMNMNISSEPGTTYPVVVGGYSSWIDMTGAVGPHNQLTMAQSFISGGAAIQEIIALNSSVTRANFTAPTPIPLRIIVDQRSDASLTAGQVFIHMEGRRMR